MDRENGKGILFGVLGVVTLIIAILGASLAYFTATSGKRDAISVKSAVVTITYTQGQSIIAGDLIPVEAAIAEKAYKKTGADQCKDDDGRAVCAVFAFSAYNDGDSNEDIIGQIISTTDTSCTPEEGQESCSVQEFDNLQYAVYQVTGTSRTKVSAENTTFAKSGSATTLFNNSEADNKVRINSKETNTYEILIWLNELAEDVYDDPDNAGNQDYEQGLSYTGAVYVSVSGATDKITGKVTG